MECSFSSDGTLIKSRDYVGKTLVWSARDGTITSQVSTHACPTPSCPHAHCPIPRCMVQDVTHVTWLDGVSPSLSSAHKVTVDGSVAVIDDTHHVHVGEQIDKGDEYRKGLVQCVGDVVVVVGVTSRRPLVLKWRGGK